MKSELTIQHCEEATRQLLYIIDGLKGWNLLLGLYGRKNSPIASEITCAHNEAQSTLHDVAQMTALATFLLLAGKDVESELLFKSLSTHIERMDELSSESSRLIQGLNKSEECEDFQPELQVLLMPVLEHMAAHGMASITIKNVSGKEGK